MLRPKDRMVEKSPTLYRRYRPQMWAEIVGQDHVVQTLQAAISKQKVAHAYLFHGPRGTGKTTTARLLAKRLNCTQARNAEPCGDCGACTAAVKGNAFDVIEIDAASNRGIDDVRALRETVSLRPAQGAYKVYIIDEVHMLTREATTALLKTLEEPVAHVVFVLATTEWHKVPSTIVSRCQVFHFRRATRAQMLERLQTILKREQRAVAADVLTFIADRSDGCYRDGESLLGQLLTINDGEPTVAQATAFLGVPPKALLDQFLDALVQRQPAAAAAIVDQALAQGFDADQLVQESMRLCRDEMLKLLKEERPDTTFATRPAALARSAAIIRALIEAGRDLAYVPAPEIALQLAILTLCTETGTHAPIPADTPRGDTASLPEAPDKVPLNAVRAKWPEVITRVKQHNLVAATFLRSMEPEALDGERLTVRAKYSLHRVFFQKPQYGALLETHLKAVLGTPIRVQVVLAGEVKPRGVSQSSGQGAHDLLAAVKEVFGSAP